MRLPFCVAFVSMLALMRSPVLIWRFLLVDLLRLGVLSAVALVSLIAFAFSVRYLAEGKIDASGAVRLTALAVIPMLQYALPFACGFAATLSYHRFAADNEDLAASAGGVSHRAALAPAFALALGLALGLGAMSHQVMPRFLRSIEKIVRGDLTGVFVRAIERGEAVRLGSFEIHAQQAARAGPDPSIGASDRVRLLGVLAVQLDERGDVQGYVSADEVGVWLFGEDPASETHSSAQLVFKGAVGRGDTELIRGGTIASQRVRIPSTFSEDPKFLTLGELLRLRREPQRFPKVEWLSRRLALGLHERRALRDVSERLRESGTVTIERVGGESLTIGAASLEPEGTRWRLLASRPDQPIVIDRRLGSGATVRLVAQAAWLEPEAPDQAWSLGESGALLRLTYQASVPGGRGPASTSDAQVIGALRAGPSPLPADATPEQLLGAARASEPRTRATGDSVATAARQLADLLDDLQREITSKLHERAAYALACFFITLSGAITALRLSAMMPLPVYLWSFFPALATVITISAGQGLTHASGTPGLFLLWGGVVLLALYTLREYRRVAKH